MEGEFGLVDSFGIDNGELEPFEKSVCFVLGCEWNHVIKTVDQHPQELNFTVHSANKDRLTASITKRNRECRWEWPHDDVSEDWIYLTVSPAEQVS